jgi:hypothetical protein
LWNLPRRVVMAVGWHHQPDLDPESALSPLTLVHLADCRIRNTAPNSNQAALLKPIERRSASQREAPLESAPPHSA